MAQLTTTVILLTFVTYTLAREWAPSIPIGLAPMLQCANNNNITVRNISTTKTCTCKTTDRDGYTWTNIDCSRRNLTKFPSNTSIPLFISRIDFSRNKITSLVESPFKHWNPVKELILSYNEIVTIIDNPFSGLLMLEVLDLSHNFLTVLPSTLLFKNKIVLNIDLSYNNISYLPVDIFNKSKNLKEISLSHNINFGQYLKQTPNALSIAFKNGLKSLVMNKINLSTIPGNFFNEALELEKLSLSDNPFKSVPNLYIGGIQMLNLSGCDIEIIKTGNFLEMPSLLYLYMDRLFNLTSVEEGAFDGLDYLKTLSMENCVQMHSFHGLAFGTLGTKGEYLKKISLVQGGLQTLSVELKHIMKGAESVQLHGNPWRCDCMLSWILDLNLTSHEKQKLRCYSPPHLRSVHAFSLTTQQMICSRPVSRVRSGLIIALTITIALLGVIVILGIIDYIRRHRWRYAATRLSRYQPIQVQLEANRAEYECEEKDMNISATQSSAAAP